MEIERKFLVLGAPPEGGGAPTQLVQGYLAVDERGEVRVRVLEGSGAYLAVKTPRQAGAISRHEVEYSIPLQDAAQMLALCAERIVVKRRRLVEHAGRAWEIDEYSGANAGLVVAEIELGSETERVELPPWVGAEVTHDARYSNRN